MLHMLPVAGQPYIDIEQLKNGELSSFQRLYKLFYPDFLAEAKIRLFKKEEAPNLVNHCFIRCWYKSDEFSSLSYVLGFLNYTFCNNCNGCNSIYSQRSTHHDHITTVITSGKIVKENNAGFLTKISTLSPGALGPVREVFKRFYAKRSTIGMISRELSLSPEYTRERLDLAFGILHLLLHGKA